MQVLHESCAGLDVHKQSVYACWRRLTNGKVTIEQKRFGSMTADLLLLAEWLSERQVTQVVMESTGVYWRPVYNILESHCNVILANAHHVKRAPGRKTDASDSEWLAELLQYGLVKPSFIPPQPVRELRELTRTRLALTQEKTEHVNRIHKVLETANIKLSCVASEIMGVSGRRMLKAISEGENDPAKLAELACGGLRKKETELIRALTGRVTDHHRFLLSTHLQMITILEDKIVEVSARIERVMAADESAKEKQEHPFAAGQALLTTIPGVSERTAQIIIAEIGLDMERFPSASHLSAWAGVVPGSNTSGERRKHAPLRKGNANLLGALVQSSWAAIKRKGSYYHALFCRIARRSGKQAAIVAVAHSMLVTIYHMLKTGAVYQELGASHFDQQDREQAKRHALQRLVALGYKVTLIEAA